MQQRSDSGPMRIFILDDCEILRLSLSIVLEQEEEFEMAGTADSKGEACQKVLESDCDILLIGLRLQNRCGLEIARQIRATSSSICIVALGHSTDAADVQEMFLAGIDSFISMSTSNQQFITRIMLARRNLSLCDFSVTASSDKLPLIA